MTDWVLLVPGFCASHLFRFDAGGDRGTKIWLSQADIAWSGVGDLDTDPDVSPAILDRVRPGSPLLEYYQPFLSYCAFLGVPVLHAGYDWRADVATNGARLAALIESQVHTDARFTIVAHSMGGLIAASAINRLSDAAVAHVSRLITCGTPWSGSYKTVGLFDGSHETVQQIVNLNRILSRRSRFQHLQETVRVVASWPGAYDLMPMPEMMQQYPPGPGQDFVSDPFFALVNPWFTVARYQEAVARRPIHVGFPVSVTHHNFRGIGQKTFGPMPSVRDGYPDFHFQALIGDGVVPEFSSHPPIAFNSLDRQFDADHEQFLNDGMVMLAVGRIMGLNV